MSDQTAPIGQGDDVAVADPPTPPEAPDHAADARRPVWERFVAWLGEDVGRKVALGAVVLIVAQGVLRAWIAYRGYFFLDDFAFTGRAARHSLTDLNGYLLQSYNSHLMPGAFVEVWILTKIWPLNFAATVTVSVVLQVLVGTAFYRLLREMFGTRPAILVPLAFYLFTPITLPAFVWWAAALNQLPQQLAMITALWCQTRYLRTGRVRVGVYGAVATAGGLLFSEKTLLTVPLVIAYTLLWFARGHLITRVREICRRHWRVLVAYLVVAVPYSAYYVLAVPSPGRSVAHGGDVVQLFGSAFAHALDPGMLGGPWSWSRVGFVGALAAPGGLVTYVSTVAVVGLVVVTVAALRRAVFAWLLALGYASTALLLLAFSRATFIGPFIGDEYRYVTDVAVVAVLAASLVLLRPAGVWWTDPQPPERRAWTGTLAQHHVYADVRDALPRVRAGVVVAVVTCLFLVSATASTVRYDRYWSTNPARPYVTTLRTELRLAPHDLVLYDQEVPAEVAWALLYPYNRLSNLLHPLPERPRFLLPGRTSPSLAITDDSGHLRRVAIAGPSALPGPVTNGCSWLLGSRQVTVQLSSTTFPWTWVLHMAYIASADTTTTLRAGATTARVALHRGLHELYLLVTGAIDHVDFSAFTNDATACTSDLEVGKAVPIDGTSP